MLRRVSHQSDTNPASIQIARGKIAVVTCISADKELQEIGEKLLWDFMPGEQRIELEFGSDPELQRWIHRDTLQQLRYIWSVIMAVEATEVQDILRMIFSDTLFRCASPGAAVTRTGLRRRHHWGWIADNVRPAVVAIHDALAIFRQRLAQLRKMLPLVPRVTDSRSGLRLEDVRQLSIQDEAIDLIVTSPPYLGMIDYTLANRLDFLWLNWSIPQSLSVEIGARRHRHRLTGIDDYLRAMLIARNEMYRVLKPAAFCAIVVGASRRHPDAVERLVAMFRDSFDICWGPTARTPSRQRISDRKGSLPSEYIIVFRK